MHQAVRRAGRDPEVSNFALHGEEPAAPIVGRLVERGLQDELKGTAYAIVEGVDGRTHHLRFPDLELTGDSKLGAVVEVRSYSDANGRKRLSLATRSDLTIDEQAVAPGATWLDHQLIAREPLPMGSGFGAEVLQAMDRSGHRAFVKWLAQTPVDRVVFEPTGPYHRASERTLGVAGVSYAKVNPPQARRFAVAVGTLAKTDRLDAAMLARMGALLQLQTRPPRAEAMLELRELPLAREALVKDRTAAKNRRNALTAPLLKRQNAQRLEQIERQMAAIEAAILKQIHADADLSRRFAILASIPRVSAVTAFALPIEMRNSAPSTPDRPPVSQASPRSPGVQQLAAAPCGEHPADPDRRREKSSERQPCLRVKSAAPMAGAQRRGEPGQGRDFNDDGQAGPVEPYAGDRRQLYVAEAHSL